MLWVSEVVSVVTSAISETKDPVYASISLHLIKITKRSERRGLGIPPLAIPCSQCKKEVEDFILSY